MTNKEMLMKTITNDRLAHILRMMPCRECPARGYCVAPNDISECEENIKNWLKQEVNDER